MRNETRMGNVLYGVSREEYDKSPRVNWSSLKAMARSPAHYQHHEREEAKETSALRLGRVRHLAILEPERFDTEVAVWRGGRRSGAVWTEFCAASEGREIITGDEFASTLAMRESVRRSELAARYLGNGHAEVTLLWRHVAESIGGSPGFCFDLKGRPDFVTADGGAIVDLKTTRDASPEGFGREAWRLGHYAQAAMYLDGYEAATGRRVPFIIVAVETEAPHVVSVYRVPDDVLELGREHYRNLLSRLAFCRSERRWPGYSEEEMALTLPPWVIREDEEDISDVGLSFEEVSA